MSEFIPSDNVHPEQLPDVDAELFEESVKLQKLYQKYDRQFLMIGEVRPKVGSRNELSLFHIMQDTDDRETVVNKCNMLLTRLNAFLMSFTKGTAKIVGVPPEEL